VEIPLPPRSRHRRALLLRVSAAPQPVAPLRSGPIQGRSSRSISVPCLVLLVLVKVAHSHSDEILTEVRVTKSALASSPGEVPTAVCVLQCPPVGDRGTTATPCALELFDEMPRLEKKRLGAATPQF
jgi:hypothetical protein